MNFISTFDELNKLYESTGDKNSKDPKDEALNEYYDEEAPLGRGELYPEARAKTWDDPVPQWVKDKYGEANARAAWNKLRSETKAMNNWRNPWESVENKNNSETLDEYYDEEAPLGRGELYPEARAKTWDDPVPQWVKDKYGEANARSAWNKLRQETKAMNNWRNAWESLEEDTEIEIVDDEYETGAATEETDFDQVILECDKCGALSIIDKADMTVDEETDLANVKDKCKSCEEKVGYKVIGCVAPYVASDEDVTEEPEADVSDDAADSMAEEEIAESLPETD